VLYKEIAKETSVEPSPVSRGPDGEETEREPSAKVKCFHGVSRPGKVNFTREVSGRTDPRNQKVPMLDSGSGGRSQNPHFSFSDPICLLSCSVGQSFGLLIYWIDET
jgi:hypothetical protein